MNIILISYWFLAGTTPLELINFHSRKIKYKIPFWTKRILNKRKESKKKTTTKICRRKENENDLQTKSLQCHKRDVSQGKLRNLPKIKAITILPSTQCFASRFSSGLYLVYMLKLVYTFARHKLRYPMCNTPKKKERKSQCGRQAEEKKEKKRSLDFV